MAWPFTVVDSMCSMLSTTVVSTRSYVLVSRPSNSSGFMPVYCHATAITGISMFGKMSVGVREIITGLRTKMSTARTMNVYGRSRATRTIHISRAPYIPIVNRSHEVQASDETAQSLDTTNPRVTARPEILYPGHPGGLDMAAQCLAPFPAASTAASANGLALFFIFSSCYNRAREVPGFLDATRDRLVSSNIWYNAISDQLVAHRVGGVGICAKANRRARKSFARRRPSSISGVMT